MPLHQDSSANVRMKGERVTDIQKIKILMINLYYRLRKNVEEP